MLSALFFYSSLIFGVLFSLRYTAAIAFCLYQIIYFTNPEIRWWDYLVPDLSYSFYTVVFMFFLVIAKKNDPPVNRLSDAKPLWWAVAFVFINAITYFYAVLPEAHLKFLEFHVKTVVIMFLAYKLIKTRQDFNYVLYGYILGAWYVSYYIFQIGRNSGNRVEGVGLVDSPDSNGLALAIAPTIVLSLYYFWVNQKAYRKFIFALAGVFIANAIVLINSRGAFLAVAAGVTFFMYHLYFSSFQRKYQKLTVIFIAVAGLSGAIYLADDDFINRVTGITGELENRTEKETGATRMIFWEAAWDMTKDYPLGNGIQGFNYYAPIYLPEGIDSGGSRHRAVHSTWFEVLTEVGYLGMIVFLTMLYSCWRHLGKAKKALRELGDVDEYFKLVAIQSGLISFCVGMSFLNRMRAEVLYWFVMFASVAYSIYVIKKEAKKENPSQVKPDNKTRRVHNG